MNWRSVIQRAITCVKAFCAVLISRDKDEEMRCVTCVECGVWEAGGKQEDLGEDNVAVRLVIVSELRGRC